MRLTSIQIAAADQRNTFPIRIVEESGKLHKNET